VPLSLENSKREGGDVSRFAIADGLRAVAIIAVVLSHVMGSTSPRFAGHSYSFTFLGTWGVATFFVLSGYLLSAPFLRAFLQPSRPRPSVKLFLIRRVLRIVPLYIVAVVFSAIVVVVCRLEPVNPSDVIAHLLMLQNFSIATVQSLNPPLWTMPVDFEFYLALPFGALIVALALGWVSQARRSSALAFVLGIVILISIAYRVAIVEKMTSTIEATAQFVTAGQFVFLSNGIGMAVSFAAGIALVLILECRQELRIRPRFAAPAVVLSIVLFLVLAFGRSGPHFSVVAGMAFDSVIATLSSVLALYGLAGISPVTRLAQTQFISSCAALAYAIYLFHFPILQAAIKVLNHPHGTAGFIELGVVSACLILPVAYAGHRLVERPFLRLKERQRERNRDASAAIVNRRPIEALAIERIAAKAN
jgi:peptidoglycan/LPS O-acetylase OafA/YrhL